MWKNEQYYKNVANIFPIVHAFENPLSVYAWTSLSCQKLFNFLEK